MKQIVAIKHFKTFKNNSAVNVCAVGKNSLWIHLLSKNVMSTVLILDGTFLALLPCGESFDFQSALYHFVLGSTENTIFHHL